MDLPVEGCGRRKESECIGQLENDYLLTVLSSRVVTKEVLEGIK